MTVRRNEIKGLYGLGFTNDILDKALEYANDNLKRNATYNEKGNNIVTDGNNVITVKEYVFHKDLTTTPTNTNFRIYEQGTEYPFTITERNANINQVVYADNGNVYIEMDGSYPAAGNNLKIQYYHTGKDMSDSSNLNIYKNLQEYFFLLYLFRNLQPHQLQRGITNKSINGVNINFDKQSIDEFIKNLRIWIKEYSFNLLPSEKTFDDGFGSKSGFYSIGISKKY